MFISDDSARAVMLGWMMLAGWMPAAAGAIQQDSVAYPRRGSTNSRTARRRTLDLPWTRVLG
jgi:hypothetical protein